MIGGMRVANHVSSASRGLYIGPSHVVEILRYGLFVTVISYVSNHN